MPRCKICDSYTSDRITIKHPLLYQLLNGLVDSDQLVCNKCLKAFQTLSDKEFEAYIFQTIKNKLSCSQTFNLSSGNSLNKEDLG